VLNKRGKSDNSLTGQNWEKLVLKKRGGKSGASLTHRKENILRRQSGERTKPELDTFPSNERQAIAGANEKAGAPRNKGAEKAYENFAGRDKSGHQSDKKKAGENISSALR